MTSFQGTTARLASMHSSTASLSPSSRPHSRTPAPKATCPARRRERTHSPARTSREPWRVFLTSRVMRRTAGQKNGLGSPFRQVSPLLPVPLRSHLAAEFAAEPVVAVGADDATVLAGRLATERAGAAVVQLDPARVGHQAVAPRTADRAARAERLRNHDRPQLSVGLVDRHARRGRPRARCAWLVTPAIAVRAGLAAEPLAGATGEAGAAPSANPGHGRVSYW